MMESFFNPKSVAVIGASRTPNKLGYVIFENFIKGFGGKVYPVNVDTTPISGREVFPSVKKIPDKIDLAVIVIPAAAVPKVLKECVEKKVGSIVIISAGFAEIGKEGKMLEEKCKKIIKGSKTRVLGPNVIGVYDSSTNVDTLFLSRERMGRPKQGSISFISQSGAVGSTILDWLSEEKIGITKFISYGNAMDVNESDLIEFLGRDEKTKVIVVYLEGIKSEGKKFIETLKRVTKIKPVIILKSGKTDKGIKAVASHTGSLAGSAKIYSSVFKQAGVIEANSWEELFDFARAFSQPVPKKNRVVIITDGGGFGVLATDECERQKLQLSEPSEKLKSSLKNKFPPYIILHNPIDLTGDATAERYRIAMEECLRSGEYDGVIAITLFQVPTLEEKITEILIEMKKFKKPIICCATGGRFTKRLSDILEGNSIPVYSAPERAVRAFNSLVKYATWLKK
jgi:acetyl coenzyme A synthetase (ADP forming)-like protein